MTWLRDNVAPWASILTLIVIALGGWVLRSIRTLVNGRLDAALTRISQLEQTIRENGYARSTDPPGSRPADRKRPNYGRRSGDR